MKQPQTRYSRILVALVCIAIVSTVLQMKIAGTSRPTRAATIQRLSSLEARYAGVDRKPIRLRRNSRNQITELRFYLEGSDLVIDNDFLRSLSLLPALKKLIVFHSDIDDDGLRTIREFPQLTHLTINHCSITDDGLQHLRGLTSLRHIQFFGTSVSREESQRLHATIPQCRILDCWCCGCMSIEPVNDHKGR